MDAAPPSAGHAAEQQPPPAAAATDDAEASARPPELGEHWTAAHGMEDSQFLGSIMEDRLREDAAPAAVEATSVAGNSVAKRKRGRPPKNPGAPRAPRARRKEDDEEVVCFICFDGGNLVVCDRRGCPKVYHPACINRDESFFRSRGKWNCGWHICSICEKAAHFMCYSCTYSLCKGCTRDAKFFCVRGSKGFCDTCFSTILLIEAKEDEKEKKVGVDFDDKDSWEYLFKLYWLDQKKRLSLTLEELSKAKNPWKGTAASSNKEESSDELYDANNDQDASSDSSSGHRRHNVSSRKKPRKQSKKHADGGSSAEKCESSAIEVQNSPKKIENEGKSLPEDTEWASPELLDLVGHMKEGNKSFITQFDAQSLLLEYIKRYNLRDPRRKSQIICDSRLHKLFGKPRVGHFEMLKLLESNFLVKEESQVTCNDNQGGVVDSDLGQLDDEGYGGMGIKLDRGRKTRKKMEREPQTNLDAYAAIDVHNISLVYLRRCLMEDLVDDIDTFAKKAVGAFVRIRIPCTGQRQDLYRLVQIVGTSKVTESYMIGKKTTDIALEILNLYKKEVVTIDAISNQEFTEEECKRLRQSIKCGLITRLKVGDVQEKARILQSVRVSEWLENEKLRLSHLRDRASETGRRKELRECVEKLQLLSTPEERVRRLNEVPIVHTDPHMDPDYDSAEEEASNNKAGNYGTGRSRNSSSNRKERKPFPLGRAGPVPNLDLNVAQEAVNNSCFSSGGPSIEGAGNTVALHTTDDHRKDSPRNQETNGCVTPGSPANAINPQLGATDPTKPCDDPPKEPALPSPKVSLPSNVTETDKVWQYMDPAGIIQGPFPLEQLAKWTSYFPRDLRVWLTFEKQENSFLLTDLLSRCQKDSLQPESQPTPHADGGVTSGTGNACQFHWRGDNNTTWVVGAWQNNSAFSSVDSSMAAVRPREGMFGTTLRRWDPSKDANAGGFREGKWNDDRAGGRDSNSRWTGDSCSLPTTTTRPSSGDRMNFLGGLSPRTTSKTEAVASFGSSMPSTGSSGKDQSTTGAALALSLNLTSNVLEQSESARASGPWPAPSLSMSNAVKMERAINQQDSAEVVAPGPMKQSSCRSMDVDTAVYNPVRDNNQHLKSKRPGPTPQCERQEPSVIKRNELDHGEAPVADASVPSDPPAGPARDVAGLQSPSRALCEDLPVRDLIVQSNVPDSHSLPVGREFEIVNPASSSMSKAESDVPMSFADQNPKSSDPQEPSDVQVCAPDSPVKAELDGFSTDILSPWREPGFFPAEAGSWNDEFSLPSPTPVSNPSGWDGDINSNPGHGTDMKPISSTGEKMNLDLEISAGPNRGNENTASQPAMRGNAGIDGSSSNITTSWGLPELRNINLKTGSSVGAPFLQLDARPSVGWPASIHGTAGTVPGAPGKQRITDDALGNANRSWNFPAGNSERGTQWWKHGDDRHLGGSRSVNRASEAGSGGGQVRPLPFRGQAQRICKYHESGYCKKGSSCNYLHP